MDDSNVDIGRRRFLIKATGVIGGLGAMCAAFPFLSSWKPSARAMAAGGPVEVDLSALEIGQQLTVQWRGKPIWIIRRSELMISSLSKLTDQLRDPNSNNKQQPSYTTNEYRSIKPEYFVAIGVCTHLGCIPTYRPDIGGIDKDWQGGFFCPCHGSTYDLAGRVFKGVPAPSNLEVPPYSFVAEKKIIIGQEKVKG